MARITVEDCLKKVPSRFTLIHLAAQRGRELMKGAPSFVKTDNKSVVTALREVAAGFVTEAEKTKHGKKAE
ncbi:MAG: DNA-directed RNA polymerase subunit omega [Deltaproteobacteria bacterium]|nr:DNA-directed RNA polymerase subunit omega [Deltaproteobacteria bacterium]